MSMATEVGTLLALLAPLLALPETPPGAVLLEAESFARCEWAVLDEPTASGGQWVRSNLADQVAETVVELPPGRYRVWVRCADNGHYPGHYQFRVTINGAEHWAGTAEPLTQTTCWQALTWVDGVSVTLRLDRADSWNTACDCFLFVPDPAYRPSSPPELRLMDARATIGRERGRVSVSFEAPAGAEGECWIALRRDRLVVWSRRVEVRREGSAPPGRERLRIECETPALRFPPPGRYQVSLEMGPMQWVGREEGDRTVAEVDLGPLLAPRPCVARVRPHAGTPTLFVNGRPVFPFAFLGVHTGHYAEFGAAGAHLYCVGCGLGDEREGVLDAAVPAQVMEDVLSRDPEALVILRVQLEPPAAWLAEHPDERVVFDDGSVGPQSFASEAWLERACASLERFVTHIRGSAYADRVVGLHLCTGYSSEWQSWGLWDDRRGDFSPAFAHYFEGWLRERYASDDALAEAWGTPGLTFGTAAVPPRSRRDTPSALLWSSRHDRPVTDFYEAYAHAASRAIARVARAVKQASGGEMLAGVFYGYAPQFGPLAAESQHLALREVLACPDVDFLSAPAMYTDRAPGGTSTFMSLTDSIRLHGKLWLNESDIRTHLQANEVGRCADLPQTLGVLRREYAAVRSRGAGQWWFDMGDGWFSDPAILSLFGEMDRLGQRALAEPGRAIAEPEIAAVLSERSALRQAGGAMGDFWFLALTAQVAALDRVGAPVGVYLLEDLDRLPDLRMVILLNAFDLTPEDERRIERLKSDGRVIVFISAAGVGRVGADGQVDEDVDGIRALTGQRVCEAEAGSFRTLLSEDDLCRGLRYANPVFGMATDAYGPELAAAPRYVVADSERVLGRFDDGGVALSVRAMPGWTSVYSAAPGLPPGLLRNLARAAGAHIYSETEDALYVGRGLVALHAREAGDKVLTLPRPMAVREVLGAPSIDRETDVIRFRADHFETRVFEVAEARPRTTRTR